MAGEDALEDRRLGIGSLIFGGSGGSAAEGQGVVRKAWGGGGAAAPPPHVRAEGVAVAVLERFSRKANLAWKCPVHGMTGRGEGGLELESLPEILQEGERDLTLELTRVRGGVRLIFKYDPDLFDEATVRGLSRQYLCLLEASLDAPGALAADLPLLDGGGRRRLLVEWNDTARDFPLDRPVHALVGERSRKREGELAVVARDESLTYGELARRSDLLARRLRREGIGPDSLVGVLLGRSASLPVALLGILETGAAYVPLDPAFPRQRLEFMVSDSGLGAIVTSVHPVSPVRSTTSARSIADPGAGSLAAMASSFGVKVVNVEDIEDVVDVEEFGTALREDSGEGAGLSPEVLLPRPGHGLAYVIYTSGSTGRPKGTRVSHRSLANLLLSMAERPGFSERDRLLAVTTISFDIDRIGFQNAFLSPFFEQKLMLSGRPSGAT